MDTEPIKPAPEAARVVQNSYFATLRVGGEYVDFPAIFVDSEVVILTHAQLVHICNTVAESQAPA